uniref:Uncharacterized protein n=1 Tax=Brassica campestris TaxID=3711 RepID=A0A3P5Z7Z7_BRACM|nr:unnamed protein product [Brassica rapa]
MEQFPILSLPPKVQGLVVKRVAHNSFEDLFRLRYLQGYAFVGRR